MDMPLLPDPVLPTADVDYLLMECTYGDKPHSSILEAYLELRDVVIKTVNRGGKIIIPAFAVGRTQDIVYFLNRMVSANEIPLNPVYVDSPLAVEASQIFLRFPDYFDEETRTLCPNTATPPSISRVCAMSFSRRIQTHERHHRSDGDHLGFRHGGVRADLASSAQ